ncbi:tRNA uridine-5-carboxymethylaminomethyl(34) synthesis GTPase MnmE [Candidatus Portiera aleyrodidarum]|uniref:tRNA modification GTPase MnmE n=1 Tax=Candidatus Portiera aleyrodidarum MED (Bemisia tabaci) TaxID=1163752 RepID=A0AAU8RP47_9GAMM|nr:tRNA uridine-5-carboxymethylaminomethyl(34) synthesis GTPase MnmE [Candidatus Portiera aleyrodidarum]AFS18763.1 tRNA modification GTPase MnmE [Candidatus Portiera aleyrodidarum BT-QVLC]AJF23977.1 tRNA modification GTPase TrmE [Candidatus Portiera aleyrodidarum MED (Bemisia tabaci)]
MRNNDIICAKATLYGFSGIGIVKISGNEKVFIISKQVLGFIPQHSNACYVPFVDSKKKIIDKGIAILFISPKSYTGENILELQSHGGPFVLDLILQHLMKLGARLAKPGEFTQRAFLNKKIDLIQAESVLKVIKANSHLTLKTAINSFEGKFSKIIIKLTKELIKLRLNIEAMIAFPSDFKQETVIKKKIKKNNILNKIKKVFYSLTLLQNKVFNGFLLNNIFKVVIIGRPNVGKSSLFNLLTEKDHAIVTNIKGTTRDLLKVNINLYGIPMCIIDTAGIRNDTKIINVIERIGIQRAFDEIESADLLLILFDDQEPDVDIFKQYFKRNVLFLRNKIDIKNKAQLNINNSIINISTKTKQGIKKLKQTIKFFAFKQNLTNKINDENSFFIQQRQSYLLDKIKTSYIKHSSTKVNEVLSENLYIMQKYLEEIIGFNMKKNILNKIFKYFCIGK